MSRSFQKSIAATLGVAIVSTGLFAGISSNANTIAQAPTPTASPMPAGSMTKPADGMSKPADGMSKPADGMNKPAGTIHKPAKVSKTIVEIASGNKSFSTLVAALKAADLVDTLAGEGPFTVFAPTNAAFEKLPKATLAKLLKPENKEQLKKILTYHVVSGAVTAKMLKSGPVDSVEGSKIAVKVVKKGTKISVRVNNANVVIANVKASNGYIHAIDTVIMPPAN